MNLPYGLYMAEAEGYLNTKHSKFQAAIKDLKQQDSLTMDDVIEVLNDHDVDYHSLKPADRVKIKNSVYIRS